MKLTNQDLENIVTALASFEHNDLDENIEKEINDFQFLINKINKERLIRKNKEGK